MTANPISQLVLMLSLPASASEVYAHAVLLESTPKDESVLASPPGQVVLRFNSKIEKKITQVVLLDSQNKRIALRPLDSGPGTSDSLVIPVPPLGPGRYQLQYRILAIDGHATPGLIRFSVLQGRGHS